MLLNQFVEPGYDPTRPAPTEAEIQAAIETIWAMEDPEVVCIPMHRGVYRLLCYEVQGTGTWGRGRSRAAARRRRRRLALLGRDRKRP